jgi:hypothetical protein
MACPEKKVDPGERIQGEKTVEDVTISAVTPDNQSQKPVDCAAVAKSGGWVA